MPRSRASNGAPSRWWTSPRLLVLLFALSLPAVTTRIYASDEVEYFSYLRSIWFDHDVSFQNEYQHFYDAGLAPPGFHETFLERSTATGRRINFGTIGAALLWLPFYLIAHVVTLGLNATGRSIPADGYSQPYITAVACASAFYGWLALVLSARLVERLGRAWTALRGRGVLAAIVVWLGTPLLFYMYVAPPMSHATSAFAVTLFVTTWISVRERWDVRGAALLGACAALMTMVREQDAFFVAGPLVDVAWTIARTDRDRALSMLRSGVAGVAAGAIAFLPQALAYLALNGYIGPSRLVARKMSWSAPHALSVLASPAHGLFFWTPLAVLAIIGLGLLAMRLPTAMRAFGVGLVVAAACQVYVAGSVESWTVAGAFGQRRFVSLTPLLVLGIAAMLAVVRNRRWVARSTAVGVAAAVWWNIALIVQFGAGLMDRQRLEPARIAYNTFVVVPRALPDLAWRYLFDRASFYESARSLRGH
jgi:hypothetical protein